MTNETYARVECEIAGKKLVLETGQIARQAHGSVLVTYGETQCFSAACTGPGREDLDFFPLTVDYREKPDAAGKIPGGFFKREGRPTTKEILTMRMIDRSIRPLFPKGFRQEVQVMSRVFGYDGESPADILAMIASFAALHISNIPFKCALGAVRIGKMNGSLCALPGDIEKRTESTLDLVVAGHEQAIVMVEASAKELPEPEMIDALELAHVEIKKIIAAIEELHSKVGKTKMEFNPPEADKDIAEAVEAYRDRLTAAITTQGKQERSDAISAVKNECLEAMTGNIEDAAEKKARVKAVKGALYDLSGSCERKQILTGTRVDGRGPEDIRQITVVPDFIRRHHGSALFTRVFFSAGSSMLPVSASMHSFLTADMASERSCLPSVVIASPSLPR
jgi:polyribonucleotide nucleotidyltransferase